MKKVSIIVPIYNEEENLERCILSLLHQSYKNLEILLLNDGSTDSSKEIIDRYQDEGILAIHKKNTGIGDTRNLGIEKSSGEYLMFIDSDDFIEPDCVLKLVQKMEKDQVDLVISNYYLDTFEKTYEIKFPDLGVTSLKEDPDLLSKINLGPCNKIYHRDLFKKINNRFPIHLKYEDAPVVVDAVIHAKKISFCSEPLFHYVIKKDGETITRDERLFDIISICSIIDAKLEGHSYVEKTNLMVKILMPYLKNSRFISNASLQKEFIDAIYVYLKRVDKNWRMCSYLKKENWIKRFILTHKSVLKLVNKFKK